MGQDYSKQNNLTMVAAGDLQAAQYHIMQISNGNGQVNIGSLATYSAMLGVLQNRPKAAGDFATVAIEGPSKIVAGAAVNSAGVYLTTNTSGRAIVAASGQMVCGKALSIAANDGELLDAYLFVPFRLSGAV